MANDCLVVANADSGTEKVCLIVPLANWQQGPVESEAFEATESQTS